MIGLYIVTAAVVIGIFLMVIFSHHRFFKMTSQVAGQVLRSEQHEVRDERERRDETTIRCRYTVHGKDYEIERTLRGRLADRFPTGAKIPVRYNPAEPHIADIAL
jgi:hypothetical protein